MERHPVSSSNILSMGYDPEQELLEVEFKGHAVYQYPHFPEELYYELESAPSIGGFFNKMVLPRFKDIGYRVE